MKFIFKIVLACIFLTLETSANSKELVKIGSYHFPPYMFEKPYVFKDGGKGLGIDLDIMVEAVKRAGYDYKIDYYPFTRLRHYISFPGKATVDVAPSFFYSKDHPVSKQFMYDFGGFTSFYKRKDGNQKVKNSDDLKKYTIGRVRDDSYGDAFRKISSKLTLEDATDNKLNFLKLAHKRVDLVVCNRTVGDFLVFDLGLKDKVSRLDFSFSYGDGPKSGGIYFRFNKKVSSKMVKKISDAAKKMVVDGTIERIKKKYGVIHFKEAKKHVLSQ